VFARPLPELELATIRDRIFADSPELAELRVAVDRARWAVQKANAGATPNVTAQAGVQHDNATSDNIANVQVSFPIPIRNRNQGAVMQACGELAAAQAALEVRQLAIEQRLTIAMRDYTTARQRVLRYTEKILPAAQETLNLINTGYQAGELEYVQVLSVQQTYAAKNLAYLDDLSTAWQRWAEIDGFLVGAVSPIGIDRVSGTTENGEGWR
jgi:cobalt-zinc-cadmium efflux system outer membrane protein